MLKSFKSFKSFKGDSNLLFQILCKSTAILLYGYEENIKKLLNFIVVLLQFRHHLLQVLLIVLFPGATDGENRRDNLDILHLL